MKKVCAAVLLIAALALLAQAPGTITGGLPTTTPIVATGGSVVCTTTWQTTTYLAYVSCKVGTQAVLFAYLYPMPSQSSYTISVTGPKYANGAVDSVGLICSKGNLTPDGWQVGANGTLKTGTF